MDNYFFLDENKNGCLGLSKTILNVIVQDSLSAIDCIANSKQELSKSACFALAKAPNTIIKNGIAHIKISIDAIKNVDIQKLNKKINDEISSKLTISLGHIPYDIQIQVESLN